MIDADPFDVTGTDADPFDLPTPQPPARVVQGRYRLPDPDPSDPSPAYKRVKKHAGTDQATSWMRATRLASIIADSYALNMWRNRAVAVGLANQPGLIARLQGLDIREDKQEIEDIVESAIRLADAIDRAAMGTRIHLATEHADRRIQAIEAGADPSGMEQPEPELIHHVVNWKTALLNFGIKVVAIEDIIAVASLGVAGRLDRIGVCEEDVTITIGQKNPRTVQLYRGNTVIVDLKTGKSLELAWHEISVQLALYANHTHRFEEHGDQLLLAPALDFRTDVAIVIHIPAMEGGAYVYGVDIDKGWIGAQLARGVADWHSMTGFSGTVEVR